MKKPGKNPGFFGDKNQADFRLLLRLDDPVLRFYPEYDPAELAPNLRRMTVRDLLMMGCGSKDKMFFWNDAQRLQCRDWQDYFLRNAFPYEPGTRFEYNNFNSYMCSCIVERAAGCTLKDYMTPLFFVKADVRGGHTALL
jgi:CubicO group peptidase (beta-lactamase class C family)